MREILDPENLRIAFYKAAKGKEGQVDVETFRADLDCNLRSLASQLSSVRLKLGDYHYFTIFEPKERVICAASFPERVLHHALMNVCHAVFERFQIYHSYATRPGKGTFAALEYAKVKNARHGWFLKMDFRKYFDSIDHIKLKELLRRKFKDINVLHAFDKIIDSYEVKPGLGLPIGNLTSQYFANFYLAFLDHYIKEQLQTKAYVRYMDDMVLWSNSKEELKTKYLLIKNFSKDQLGLTLKPLQVNLTSHGLPFLGFRLKGGVIRLSSKSKYRFQRKARIYANLVEKEGWSQNEYQLHIRPLLAFVLKGDTYDWRQKIFT